MYSDLAAAGLLYLRLLCAGVSAAEAECADIVKLSVFRTDIKVLKYLKRQLQVNPLLGRTSP
jgi:hypothetical protein